MTVEELIIALSGWNDDTLVYLQGADGKLSSITGVDFNADDGDDGVYLVVM